MFVGVGFRFIKNSIQVCFPKMSSIFVKDLIMCIVEIIKIPLSACGRFQKHRLTFDNHMCSTKTRIVIQAELLGNAVNKLFDFIKRVKNPELMKQCRIIGIVNAVMKKHDLSARISTIINDYEISPVRNHARQQMLKSIILAFYRFTGSIPEVAPLIRLCILEVDGRDITYAAWHTVITSV